MSLRGLPTSFVVLYIFVRKLIESKINYRVWQTVICYWWASALYQFANFNYIESPFPERQKALSRGTSSPGVFFLFLPTLSIDALPSNNTRHMVPLLESQAAIATYSSCLLAPGAVLAKDGNGWKREGRRLWGGELTALMFVVLFCRGSIPFKEFEFFLNISARSC